MKNKLILTIQGQVYKTLNVKTLKGARRSKLRNESIYGAYLSGYWIDGLGNKIVLF